MSELTVDEVKALSSDVKILEVRPGAKYILACDLNGIDFKQGRSLLDYLGKMGVADCALVFYDGSVVDEPLKFYEVKRETR